MTDNDLQKLLDVLNSKKHKKTIFIRQISENVFISKVSSKINYPEIKPYSFGTFFFIMNEKEKFISTIENRGQRDLHWYVTKKSRKKGYLTKALKETIIPYIFYDEDIDYQRITINENIIGELNYENSKKVALKTGFKPLNEEETEFELRKEEFDWSNEKIKEINTFIEDKKFQLFKNKIERIHYDFEKICNELEMAYGSENVYLEELKKISKEIKYSKIKVDDLIFFENKKINNIG